MESKLKTQAMESVGELPAGYLHLPTTPIKQEPELTDWISGDILPTIDGVYQRATDGDLGFAYWIFKEGFWRYGGFKNAEMCVTAFSDRRALSQNKPWRGLAKNPEVQE